MSIKDHLSRLSKAVAQLSGDPVEPQGKPMNTAEFMEYVTAQIEKAATDKPETRKRRLKHIAEVIEMAKNYEGPTPTPTGPLVTVNEFKDADQLVPTKTETNPPMQAAGATNFGVNDVPPNVVGAGTPPSNVTPPGPAAGSGFETTFSKSLEKLEALISKMETATPPPPAAPPAPVVTPPAATPAQVQKAAKVVWPADLAADLNGDTDPDWGHDPGSEGERLSKERAAAPAK